MLVRAPRLFPLHVCLSVCLLSVCLSVSLFLSLSLSIPLIPATKTFEILHPGTEQGDCKIFYSRLPAHLAVVSTKSGENAAVTFFRITGRGST